MNGHVDNAGRSLISISLKAFSQSTPTQLEAWIDTGFTGELVLAQATISALGFSQSGTVNAELADGSSVVLKTYACLIDWFGKEKRIQALANNGPDPLLGVGMLRAHRLTVDYPAQTLTIR
jgi:clan AA aspartic protease